MPIFVLLSSIFLACFTTNDADNSENKTSELEHRISVTALQLLLRIASAFTFRMCVWY